MIKRNESRLKFNLIDGLVLFLALICISTIVTRAFVIDKKYQPLDSQEYQMEFEIELTDDMKKAAAENIFAGHKVVWLTNERFLGFIDQSYEYVDENTKIRSSLIIQGKMIEHGFELDENTIINIGDEIEIGTELVKLTVKIVSLEKK